jgi:aryl-alcohol dehydrogenase-like predicted oxidoreductase
MWQVSGAHGPINPTRAIPSMFEYTDAGFTTWDLADHYGPAEDFIGEFRRQLVNTRAGEAVNNLQAFTKWVPRPGTMSKEIVEQNINISLRRMGVECLDLLQFHWWDYGDSNYLDALHYLGELQQEGKIKHLGLTNFDTEHLKIIAGEGIKIVANQVQFSLLDRRPLVKMVDFCQQEDIKILAYGTLAGGLLSKKYYKHPEPGFFSLNTASHRKYKNMVDAWGGWLLFQELLSVLDRISKKHKVTIPNLAARYVLEQPMVAGVIIGARLGVSEHIAENARVFDFSLDQEDYQQLESVFSQSQNLFELIGDCGDEYRRR